MVASRSLRLIAVAGLLALGLTSEALAQNDPVSGLFHFLFGGQQQQSQPQGAPGQPGVLPPGAQPPKTATKPKPAEPRIVEQPKDADARVVTVIGDAQAAALAAGLQVAFADTPGVVVSRRTRAASGIVREDGIDWMAQLPEVLAEGKNDYIVVMLGLNDRQTFLQPAGATTKPDDIRSEKWEAAYRDRLARLTKILRDTGKPVYWVGQAPVERPTLNAFLEYLNDVQKAAAEAANIPFIDVWEGFTDDDGAYSAFGPDVDGRERRLRSDDGYSFTRAGQRKLAYFVEQEIRGAVRDGPVAEPTQPEAPAAPQTKEEAMLAAPPPLPPAPWKRVGPVITLGDKGLTGETELAGAPAAPPTPVPVAAPAQPAGKPGQPAAQISIVRPADPKAEPPKPATDTRKPVEALPGGYPVAETPYAKRMLRGEEIERPSGRADSFVYDRVADRRGG